LDVSNVSFDLFNRIRITILNIQRSAKQSGILIGGFNLQQKSDRRRGSTAEFQFERWTGIQGQLWSPSEANILKERLI
jgi:hypothetical protein